PQPGLILRRPPGEGNGYPLQYSCLENPTERGTWQAWEAHLGGVGRKYGLGSGATRLFCDVYNPQSKRYYKQLPVLGPEHSMDPKTPPSIPHHHSFYPQVPDDEVCGCPLLHNVFEVTDDFCCLPKCFCNLHYCWAKLRRVEVDLECVRAVGYKAESEVRTAIMNRTGLLALMLHQATQHDPLTTDLRSRVDS
ncbi:hypothetical protein FD755_024401, partial [Muntiacus reevesi]